MKKVETIIRAYQFESNTYQTYTNDYSNNLTNNFEQLLSKKIKNLEDRLKELKELREFMSSNEQVYLFKNNDSKYGYTDVHGKNYQFHKIQGKPILVDENLNFYEIIEYVETNDLGQDTGTRTCVVSWVDKVVKVKKIN